eukprot:jgi/Chrzof1/12604/Cz07g00200.t1
MLRALCAALSLPWQPSMLHWAAGPKPYDGLWAPWWYGNTHRSTGFDVLYRDMKEPMPERLRPLLGECWPMFELLRRHAITPLADEGVIPRSPKSVSHSNSHTDRLQTLEGGVSNMTLDTLAHLSATASQPSSSRRSTADTAVSAEQQQQQQQQQQPGAMSANAAAGGGGQKPGGGKSGTHVYIDDPRNADVLVGMRDGVSDTFELVWRPQVFFSGGGWERGAHLDCQKPFA